MNNLKTYILILAILISGVVLVLSRYDYKKEPSSLNLNGINIHKSDNGNFYYKEDGKEYSIKEIKMQVILENNDTLIIHL